MNWVKLIEELLSINSHKAWRLPSCLYNSWTRFREHSYVTADQIASQLKKGNSEMPPKRKTQINRNDENEITNLPSLFTYKSWVMPHRGVSNLWSVACYCHHHHCLGCVQPACTCSASATAVHVPVCKCANTYTFPCSSLSLQVTCCVSSGRDCTVGQEGGRARAAWVAAYQNWMPGCWLHWGVELWGREAM